MHDDDDEKNDDGGSKAGDCLNTAPAAAIGATGDVWQ